MAENFFSQENSNYITNYSSSYGGGYEQSDKMSTSSSLSSSLSSIPSSIENPRTTASFRYFGPQSYNMNIKSSANCMPIGKFPSNHAVSYMASNSNQSGNQYSGSGSYFNRNRYTPYQSRQYLLTVNCNSSNSGNTDISYYQNHQHSDQSMQSTQYIYPGGYTNERSTKPPPGFNHINPKNSTGFSGNYLSCNSSSLLSSSADANNQPITLQISNLDYSLEEANLRTFLLNQLKPITPVVSLNFEGSSYAKVTVPDLYYAKLVVANLHRKKVGHKRMVVSYTRDSSLTEIHTLRCQVAGLLKDVPYCTLPMYKFRELFQSRFKTSISVLDLYRMQDICTIAADKSEEKYISLNQELIHSVENSPLMKSLQDSVPYCSIHFQKEQHKGWAEQDIEPLPNVFMTICETKKIIFSLLKNHRGDIPVSSLIHCIAGELNTTILENENGVNLEHLVCCVSGIQVTTNSFGIKILGWIEPENVVGKENENRLMYSKSGSTADPLYQISREVIELVKMSPKATMKFNRFIPAYHNHFGKQCRVADYGYTKLIELFEALSSVIQIMGDGENRQITLTHRTQIRRFTTDLLRILRSKGHKSMLLSQLPEIFSQTQSRQFDVTDYGVCSIVDILDGLVNSNIVVVTPILNGRDILISIPKRKQTSSEVEKTCIFAGEVVELFRNAPQYTISFQKFVRSYHYHFGYQCRLSDYGCLKLADLMESIQGIVEIEFTNDEDKKIFLTPKVARRVFAEQLEDLVKTFTGTGNTSMKLDEVLKMHKKRYGYQIQSQTLGCANMIDAIRNLPYVEIVETDSLLRIICRKKDQAFRNKSYRACKLFLDLGAEFVPIKEFINAFSAKFNETLPEESIMAMKHLLEIKKDNDKYIGITRLMKYLLNIIKLLENKFLTLSEIKSILNIGINDCFEFGYPNLFTLIRAYSDIFTCEMGPTEDRSEIGLAISSEFISSYNHNINYERNNNIINGNVKPAKTKYAQERKNYQSSSACQPLTSKNKIQCTEFNNENRFYKNDNKSHQELLLSAIAPSELKSKHLDNKLSLTLHGSGHFNGSFNSSSASCELNSSFLNCGGNKSTTNNSCCDSNDSNSFGSIVSLNLLNCSRSNTNESNTAMAANSSDEAIKLWGQQNHNYFNNNIKYCEDADIFDLLKTTSTLSKYNCNEPPKPDTPPILPLWCDPVWSNNKTNGETSPKNDLLNLNIPEMKTLNILPILISPYSSQSKENENDGSMFSFNSSDKKI